MIETMSNKNNPLQDEQYIHSLNALATMLFQIHQKVIYQALGSIFEDLKEHKIEKMSQASAMLKLYRQQRLTVTEISQYANLSLPATSHMVDRFVKYGLAVRDENPRNRREKVITLTEQGRVTFQKLDQMLEEKYQEMFDNVDLKELAQLKDHLDRVLTRANPIPLN